MSSNSFLWSIYCITESQSISVVSSTQPVTCPHNPYHTIDTNLTKMVDINSINCSVSNPVFLQSSYPSNQAITLGTTGNSGGINISGSSGGVNINTTGLVQVNGNLGISIGNTGTAGNINIGTSGSRNIIIGNQTGNSKININGGTGGISMATSSGDINVATTNGAILLNANGVSSTMSLTSTAPNQDLTLSLLGATSSRLVLSSQGTGLDSILLNSTNGGLRANTTKNINLISNNSIVLDTTGGSGGISLLAGSSGINFSTNGSVTSIGTSTSGEKVVIGNVGGASYVGIRTGTGGLVTTQQAPTSLPNANSTLTMAQLLTNILLIAPSLLRTLTLDTATNLVSGLYAPQIGDSIDFIFLNSSALFTTVIAVGAGGTLTGSGVIAVSNSGTFRLRFTNVSPGTQAYDLYRIG